jgi:hypothetical protein
VDSAKLGGRARKKKKMGPGGESGRDPQEREAATGKEFKVR